LCSADDQRRDEKTIRNYSSAWKKKIKAERAKIIKENVPAGVGKTDSSLGNIELQINLLAPCSTAVVTASYAWELSYPLSPTTRKNMTVSVTMTIPCRKVAGKWVCG
jgi:hypothetical protein